MSQYIVYTDGSCLWNPWFGGYAAIIIHEEQEHVISWYEAHSTNNKMELTAVVKALEYLHDKSWTITIHMDSNYIHQWITGYINTWQRNWWLTATKEPVKNQELWQSILRLSAWKLIKRVWVKAHADDEYNNKVDKIARKEAKKIKTNS